MIACAKDGGRSFGSLVFGRFDRHRTIALSVMAFLCILYLLDELGVVQLPHLQSHKRVPASWRLWRHYRAAGLYGLVLGVGVGTPIPLSVFYIALAWCIVIGDPVISALTQSILAKAFRGELVPTEAELARREGRDYEPASMLLERIKREPEATNRSRPKGKRTEPRSWQLRKDRCESVYC